jgi:Zn finger protein HypA/HybF involved in hydrogenase expression
MTDELLSLDNLLQSNLAAENISGKGKKVSDSAKTLESYHSLKLSKLRDDKLNIPQLQTELEEKKRKLQMIEKEFMSPTFITNTNDVLILTSRQALENEIRQLESQLEIIHNGTAEADYFLRVGDILFSYSDAQDRIASGEKPSERNAKKERMPANSVCSYFHNEKPEVVDNVPIEIKTKKASDISNDIGFKRDKALESYLTALNPDSLQHENSIVSSLREDYGSCPVCETEMFLNETFLDCPGCGYRDCILVDSEKPSYKDPPREMSYYAYKKINHLNEWLAQFQAKETTEISSAVLDQIRTELRKERITDMGKLKPSKLKEVIKKLKLNRCYDHVAHILNRLNGISAPVLSREVEEKLRFMFKEIQFSFVKHCPKKRSNFLSYSFVLYKFCELLELDDYLPCFPLLKSREKLYMQDKIWQKICEDMGWEFIRTV